MLFKLFSCNRRKSSDNTNDIIKKYDNIILEKEKEFNRLTDLYKTSSVKNEYLRIEIQRIQHEMDETKNLLTKYLEEAAIVLEECGNDLERANENIQYIDCKNTYNKLNLELKNKEKTLIVAINSFKEVNEKTEEYKILAKETKNEIVSLKNRKDQSIENIKLCMLFDNCYIVKPGTIEELELELKARVRAYQDFADITSTNKEKRLK